MAFISFNNGFNTIYGGFGWFPTFMNNIPKHDRITIKIKFHFELSMRIITTIKQGLREEIFSLPMILYSSNKVPIIQALIPTEIALEGGE